MNDFYPPLKRILIAAGCLLIRKGRGDHEVWTSPKASRPFTVDTKIKSRHTENAVLKQAGLPKAC